jgi:hypothetical protein
MVFLFISLKAVSLRSERFPLNSWSGDKVAKASVCIFYLSSLGGRSSVFASGQHRLWPAAGGKGVSGKG